MQYVDKQSMAASVCLKEEHIRDINKCCCVLLLKRSCWSHWQTTFRTVHAPWEENIQQRLFTGGHKW